MNKSFLTIIFLLTFLFLSQSSFSAIDSLRVETIKGKKFIVHKVDPKETLYALSKRYQVSVEAIRENNEAEKDGYAIDQIGRILYIPLKMDVQNSQAKEPSKRHKVKSGETLYSLSKKYNVSVDQLKEWNDLTSNQLALGQELIVGKKATKQPKESKTSIKDLVHTVDVGETIYGISRKYDVPQESIKTWNNLSSNEISVGQKLVIRRKVKEDKESNKDNIAATKDKPVQSASVKKFHVAKAGETYADVADQYNLLLSDVENWNVFEEPFAGGEVIKIVAPEANTAQTRDNIEEKEGNSKIDDEKIHTVTSGETLYSISSQYDIAIEDLRKWNNLDNYQLSLGQKLYIKNPDAFVVDEAVEDEVDKEKEETPTVDVVNMASDKPKQDTKAYFTVEEEDIPKIEKVVEKGVAEVIEGSDNTEKYLALHRTAKIGTIMQVRNDLNDQIVFVRVLGKLPDTGVDEKVIIRISKKAFQRLGGVDYKFPVEISYLPLND